MELAYTKASASPEYESLSFDPVDDAHTYEVSNFILYTPHMYKKRPWK